jgi:hypothetical protein
MAVTGRYSGRADNTNWKYKGEVGLMSAVERGQRCIEGKQGKSSPPSVFCYRESPQEQFSSLDPSWGAPISFPAAKPRHCTVPLQNQEDWVEGSTRLAIAPAQNKEEERKKKKKKLF